MRLQCWSALRRLPVGGGGERFTRKAESRRESRRPRFEMGPLLPWLAAAGLLLPCTALYAPAACNVTTVAGS